MNLKSIVTYENHNDVISQNSVNRCKIQIVWPI